MGRAEGIVHVKIAELRQRFGELRIVRFFLRLETHILEQRHVAFVHVRDDRFRNLADRVVTENDRMIDERVQMIGHRPQRIFLDRLSFRPAEVRHQNCLRAVFAEIIDRRQTFADAGVIGDAIFPSRSSVGTLKSTRTRTRLPRTSRSRRVVCIGWSHGVLE